MKILAFDTSASGFSVALTSDDRILTKTAITEAGKQSEFLILEIEKILKENKIWYQDLDLIATTNGPGSFTGTRIGLTTARTIKLATNLPLILINSCEAVAYKYHEKSEKIFVLLDAKADDFFYTDGYLEPQLARRDDLLSIFPKEKFFLCGSGKKIAAEILKKEKRKFEMSEEEDEIEADLIALLAHKKFQKNRKGTQDLDPIYLRDPRISERKK